MVESEGLSVAVILRSFQAVQVQRAQQYARLHDSFRRFVDSKQEGIYKQILQEVTVAFNECSLRVLALIEMLQSQHRSDLAVLLRDVQEEERDKLRLELSLLALKQAHAFEVFSWQRTNDDEVEAQDSCDVHHEACCSCATTNGSDAIPGEATKAEYEAAVNEACLTLDKNVQKINELLEEVKYALAEEDEADNGGDDDASGDS